jgi:hypothetical protein
MARRSGTKAQRRNSRIVRHRPALDARLAVLVTLLGELRGQAGTLAIDEVVRVGLEREGLKAAVDLALLARVDAEDPKDDLEKLAAKLREIMDGLELEGTQMMAS